MGYQVDKFNRKYLLIICSLIWNIICVSIYFTTDYYMLIAIRISFAIVSSVHTPCCISLINDFFQHENRAKANSVYVAAISVGVGFANLTSFINEAVGWRDSILVVSGIGMVATILIFFMEEPLRQADRGT
jgi:predicted MFS family arabinose efflux permease